jgi:hypothetical protein
VDEQKWNKKAEKERKKGINSRVIGEAKTSGNKN